MSNLDILYKHYKTYTVKFRLTGLSHYQLILHEDGTGRIEKLDYEATADNPFRVVREAVLPFHSIIDGMLKMEQAIKNEVAEEEIIEIP